MPWPIESDIDEESIEKTEATDQGYSFWLKGIPIEIQIILSVNPAMGGFNFYLSHFIHTPKQIGPYHPSRPWGDNQAYALHLAATAITQHYRDAIKAGFASSAKWLVPNERGI